MNVSLSAEEVVEVKQMVEAILEDGTSIYSDSDTWAAGVRVFGKDADGNEVVIADGEYKTAEGIVVVVEGGLVTELKPMEEEAPEVEVVIEEEQPPLEAEAEAEVPTEEGTEEEATDEEPEAEAEEVEQSDEDEVPAILKLKVNGEEVEKPIDEIVALAQQGLKTCRYLSS